MTPYFEDFGVQIYHGDVLETLKQLPSNSFDAAFCDPPYGLSSTEKRSPQRKSGVEPNKRGFMGLEWDGQVPGPLVWRELLRCLVPGAMLLAFGGTRTHHRLMCAIEDGWFEIRDCLMWLYGSGFPKSLDIGSGIGTALKPAWEPIIMAMKPMAGTFANNLSTWGVGGLNIDASRIPTEDDLNGGRISAVSDGWDRPWKHDATAVAKCRERGDLAVAKAETLGRWPANVILDETAAALLDEQMGTLKSGANPVRRGSNKFSNTYSLFEGQRECEPARGADSGGASRFFYCAKASPSERDGNNHPTVKPLKLTEYLAKLVLPPKRDHPRRLIIPYSGSGSELSGALSAGWDEVVGIEREQNYIEIAKTRISSRVLQ